MVKVLVSPKDLEEAEEAIRGGASIIDVKNPSEGSLGANFPWVIRDVAVLVKKHGREMSATIGDFDFKPGTASLAALGAAYSGADYIKVGLYSFSDWKRAVLFIKKIVRAVKDYDSEKKVVIACYADFVRVNSLNPLELPLWAEGTDADGLMIDTAIKDGKSTFEFMELDDMRSFIENSRERGFFTALAGSIGWMHLPAIRKLSPDIIGVRTMVCENGRDSSIKAELVARLIKEVC